jgi:hypothetical protein
VSESADHIWLSNEDAAMAIEQLFDAVPLHYVRHGISSFGIVNAVLAIVVTVVVGVLADYVWMLYLRSKMVRNREASKTSHGRRY